MAATPATQSPRALLMHLMVAAVLSTSPVLAHCASISVTGTIAVVHGTIKEGDEVAFSAAVSGRSITAVELNSGGGSVVAALEMGRRIRSLRLPAVVPPGALCASACALMWLAGVPRIADEGSFIGFHAAYVYRNGIPVESGAGNALVGAYLNELGLSTNAVLFVTSAPPQGVSRLDKATAERIGIPYTSIRETQRPLVTQNTQLGSPRSPIAVVEAFYKALTLGDGAAASSLVVPQKRGIGPFNEQNITSFYRNMTEPLTVTSVESSGLDSVTVRYRYRIARNECLGVAHVKTLVFMGSTLIQQIKANC